MEVIKTYTKLLKHDHTAISKIPDDLIHDSLLLSYHSHLHLQIVLLISLICGSSID